MKPDRFDMQDWFCQKNRMKKHPNAIEVFQKSVHSDLPWAWISACFWKNWSERKAQCLIYRGWEKGSENRASKRNSEPFIEEHLERIEWKHHVFYGLIFCIISFFRLSMMDNRLFRRFSNHTMKSDSFSDFWFFKDQNRFPATLFNHLYGRNLNITMSEKIADWQFDMIHEEKSDDILTADVTQDQTPSFS